MKKKKPATRNRAAPREAFLDKPIEQVDFGRLYNVRVKHFAKMQEPQLVTMRDLAALTEQELKWGNNIGRGSVSAISNVLAVYGVGLGNTMLQPPAKPPKPPKPPTATELFERYIGAAVAHHRIMDGVIKALKTDSERQFRLLLDEQRVMLSAVRGMCHQMKRVEATQSDIIKALQPMLSDYRARISEDPRIAQVYGAILSNGAAPPEDDHG